MARGRRENLVSLADRTTNEQREIARKGGKASGVARRKQKTLKEAFAAGLAAEMQTTTGEVVTVAAALARVTLNLALKGNMKALQRVESITCEKEQKVDVTNSDGSLKRKPSVDLSTMTPEQIAELARAVYRGQ